MQNKPNFKNTEMNITALLTNRYENLRPFRNRKNKPNQTQFWLCNSPALAVKWQAKYVFLCELSVLCGKKLNKFSLWLYKIRIELC